MANYTTLIHFKATGVVVEKWLVKGRIIRQVEEYCQC
jgi:hypothetical protein